MLMKTEDIEKIYAGWLGKMIGIRMGAPIEGFSYEQIKNIYGEPDGYLFDYRGNEFAATKGKQSKRRMWQTHY